MQKLNYQFYGEHNILNSLACTALCSEYGISKHDIKSALSKFTGANRRFELVGSKHNVTVYDDYAHHPNEILATAVAMKNKIYRQSWVIFQPHTYSRTKILLDDFARVLTEFDNIIISSIYAARETNTFGISSNDLVAKIKSLGKHAIFIPDFEGIVNYVKEHSCPQDIVLTIGAGNICDVGKMIVK
jgi:UDP-N-acetylmuramate--alanine ligase